MPTGHNLISATHFTNSSESVDMASLVASEEVLDTLDRAVC